MNKIILSLALSLALNLYAGDSGNLNPLDKQIAAQANAIKTDISNANKKMRKAKADFKKAMDLKKQAEQYNRDARKKFKEARQSERDAKAYQEKALVGAEKLDLLKLELIDSELAAELANQMSIAGNSTIDSDFDDESELVN